MKRTPGPKKLKKGRHIGIVPTAKERDQLKLLKEIAEKNRSKYAEEDRRILEALGAKEDDDISVSDETLSRYLDYLKENLALPCIVTGREDFSWEEYYVIGPGKKSEYEKLKKTRPSYTDEFEIMDFHDEFGDMGEPLVHVRRISDKKEFDLPLADLEAVDEESRNAQLLDDFSSWFVNH